MEQDLLLHSSRTAKLRDKLNMLDDAYRSERQVP
jgi:hypothetical protein